MCTFCAVYFGELEAFDQQGLMGNPREPLFQYKPVCGTAVAEGSVIASERCEMLVMDNHVDIRAFKHCLQLSTLELVDKFLNIGQYVFDAACFVSTCRRSIGLFRMIAGTVRRQKMSSRSWLSSGGSGTFHPARRSSTTAIIPSMLCS